MWLSLYAMIWANQPINLFLVGCPNPCLQETNVRLGSPQPYAVLFELGCTPTLPKAKEMSTSCIHSRFTNFEVYMPKMGIDCTKVRIFQNVSHLFILDVNLGELSIDNRIGSHTLSCGWSYNMHTYCIVEELAWVATTIAHCIYVWVES